MITKISKGCQGSELDGTTRDSNMYITKTIGVAGGKISTGYLSITSASVQHHLVPWHHSAGTKLAPTLKSRYAKLESAGSGSKPMPPTLTRSIISDKTISLYACYATTKCSKPTRL